MRPLRAHLVEIADVGEPDIDLEDLGPVVPRLLENRANPRQYLACLPLDILGGIVGHLTGLNQQITIDDDLTDTRSDAKAINQERVILDWVGLG